VRPAVARTVHTVDFGDRTAPPQTQATTGRIPRVARLLALRHMIEGKIRTGKLRDFADAARELGVTRARTTQITNLLLLAPEIQEAILALPPVTKGRDPISERTLRSIVQEPNWEQQVTDWSRLSAICCGNSEHHGCRS